MFKKVGNSLLSVYIVFVSSFLFALLGPACRFEESCSNYTRRKIKEEGAVKGTCLGILRIIKCQPFYSGNLRKESI